MNDEFATAMRRSLDLTRAGNLTEATQAIQQALGGGATAPRPAAARARKPLGQTLDGLRRRKTPDGKTPPVAMPDGALFEARHHAGPQGARDYRLYVPSCGAEKVRGLIVMLHGCTQTPEDFAAGTQMNVRAEAADMAVAWPEQTRGHNANLCWNWFEPAHQQAARGEPAILAALAQELVAEFKLPAGRCFAAGLSSGGAMAAILSELHPDTFRAVGVHSGLPSMAAGDMPSAFAAMRGSGPDRGHALSGPAIVFHGLADPTVAPVNAGRLAGTIQSPQRDTPRLGERRCQRTVGETGDGHPIELWLIEGAGHAWSGGSTAGSHADATGPDASGEMIRFFTSLIED
jgi:poly(hydroxyalkanoate) depolymerase family esterase